MLERSAHAPLLLCGGREQSTCCCCCSHSLTCTGNLPVSQSEALALQFVFSEARAADVDPETSNWSGTKSDPDQRRGGGGHSLIIPPREDRWRVVVEVVEGLAPVYVAGNKKIKTRWQAAGGGVTGSVPTCSPDRRSPPGHRAAQHRETPGHLRTHRDTPGHTSGHFGEHSHICSCFREEVRAAALFCSFCVWSAGGRTPVGLLSFPLLSSPARLLPSPFLSSPLSLLSSRSQSKRPLPELLYLRGQVRGEVRAQLQVLDDGGGEPERWFCALTAGAERQAGRGGGGLSPRPAAAAPRSHSRSAGRRQPEFLQKNKENMKQANMRLN